MMIYKILDQQMWEEASRIGTLAGAPVDLADGYIHFSTAEQLAETAAKHFAGRSGLVLVAAAAEDLGPELRWEPSRGGALFPHLHRPLETREALWVAPLPLGADGRHRFPDLESGAPGA